jgi:serine/alanine adding enzyme
LSNLEYQCCDLADDAAWREALAEFAPQDDIYFSPDYLAAYEARADGKVECLIVRQGDSVMLLPYLIYPIPEHAGLFDIQGAYGYGGPLVKNPNPGFLKSSWSLIREHWQEKSVVAAFLRCHPMLENAGLFDDEWDVVFDRPTVSVDLADGVEEAFAGPHARKHRRDVTGAQRAGAVTDLLPCTPDTLDRFARMYWETMTRLGAGSDYFFSRIYFKTLAERFAHDISIAEVRTPADGRTLSMALIFWGPRWAHYHLGGRSPTEGNRNTFHLLLQSVAEEAVRRGLVALHLGGGRTSAPDDSLLAFKKRIGNIEQRFHTARLVVHSDRYNDLVRKWCAKHPEAKPAWFLAYRQ